MSISLICWPDSLLSLLDSFARFLINSSQNAVILGANIAEFPELRTCNIAWFCCSNFASPDNITSSFAGLILPASHTYVGAEGPHVHM